jgi:hypothetical protein
MLLQLLSDVCGRQHHGTHHQDRGRGKRAREELWSYPAATQLYEVASVDASRVTKIDGPASSNMLWAWVCRALVYCLYCLCLCTALQAD